MNDHPAQRPVVVGVDDSDGARAALGWAAKTADPEGWPLLLVHGYPDLVHPPSRGFISPEDVLRSEAAEILARAEKHLSESGWQGQVGRMIQRGTPDSVLSAISGNARMIVVGRRGAGGFADMLIGSAAYTVAEHARIPVVIVPDRWAPAAEDNPVVLGLERKSGHAAITFAFDTAARSGQNLEIVHVCEQPLQPYAGVGGWPMIAGWTSENEQRLKDERRWLSEQVAGWAQDYPDVRVDSDAVWGSPAGILLDKARSSSLLVVGGKDHGPVMSMLVGSVARTLLHQAPCPLAVVHAVE